MALEDAGIEHIVGGISRLLCLAEELFNGLHAASTRKSREGYRGSPLHNAAGPPWAEARVGHPPFLLHLVRLRVGNFSH